MTDIMRGAIFVGDGQVEVQEFPRPKPTGTQVLVQLKASGLCGSDMHTYRNNADYWSQYPIIRGHEPGGVIVEVGNEVTMVNVGDRVSVYHAPYCGHCEACARGELFNCTTIGPGYRLASLKVHGADADYVLVDQNVCFPLDDTLNYEDAAVIACAGGTAYHALRRADVHGADYVLVSGLGPVGLCATKLAAATGGTVIGVDPIAYRRDLALKHGATYALDPTSVDMPETVKDLTNGGAERAIETSGNDKARVDMVKATPYHAHCVYVGWGGRANNGIYGPMLGERWITGSNMFTSHDYWALTRFLIRNKLHFSDLVTHRFALENAQTAFDTFAKGDTGKVVFVWD